MTIPGSLNEEHAHLRKVLDNAVREEGALGEAARAVMEALSPHMEKEERLALPPLGLLTLSGDEPKGDIDSIIELASRFGDELPRMLEEHVIIAEKLEVMSLEAGRAGREEYATFAGDLLHHARVEEEIVYPASLLVGAYLRLWKSRKRT
jgi:iron-sulfur cluster repair protein YtfE (RIC family)